MLLQKTNIERKLAEAKKRQKTETMLLQEVYTFLAQDTAKEHRIEKNIQQGSTVIQNRFDFDALETKNIYHIDHIKEICINYRLRFLDSKYFKANIPQEAIQRIKALEKEHQIEIKGFKIIAPSKLFKLEDKDDPLLFAPIGNDYFYLIHKWGDDLHPFRRAIMWPFKNILNLIVVLVLGSYIVTKMIPAGLFSKSGSNAEFWILFFFTFKSVAAIAIFYGFALGKNFSPAIWKSKYFNA
ncbi:hypothetical protein [Spongiimicrobium salis]|uniref:hypothetical protein n=1 Tax=Spongiimicrobium salis TaxID=1667022 RepID=UPI00374CBE0C